jgi:hypothetical protein
MLFSRIVCQAVVFFCAVQVTVECFGATPASGIEAQSSTQSLEAKLARKADFVPKDKPPLEQLVEIGRHYDLPMGIEWMDQADQSAATPSRPNLTSDMTVQEMIASVLLEAPLQQLRIEDGVIHIFHPSLADSPNNLLALRIPSFQVVNENLPGAEARLRSEIRRALNHNAYPNGFGGSLPEYTSGPLSTRNISLQFQNVTVRQILDGIIRASKQALWVAHFPQGQRGSKRSDVPVNQDPLIEKVTPIDYPWKLIIFEEIATDSAR